jgi:hypothetical protein
MTRCLVISVFFQCHCNYLAVCPEKCCTLLVENRYFAPRLPEVASASQSSVFAEWQFCKDIYFGGLLKWLGDNICKAAPKFYHS